MSKTQCCILAAGPNRYTGSPCSLWEFANGNSIIDWQVNSFHQADKDSRVTVIVGYHYDEIVQKFPQLDFFHALNWKTGSALDSFLQAPFKPDKPVVAMYGDTVFHPETLADVSKTEADLVVGIDSHWRSRFEGRSLSDINQAETLDLGEDGVVEYTGLIKFSKRAMQLIASNKHETDAKNFVELIKNLGKAGLNIKYHDVRG